VTLVAANVSLPAPDGVRVREVVSAAELKGACEEEFAGCEILLMAAAVADFRPVDAHNGKIKKSGRERLELQLEPTADVLSGLAASRRDGQTLVGFAAEHGAEAVQGAREKLLAKGLDAIVVNDISRPDIGFDSEANEVTIFSAPRGTGELQELHVPRAGKREVAEAILDAAERLRTSG
jgi:phosphopantothenoylcysteine decarboxylase/phosphopantothenate--cysteine ligase